jgi:hypothetical protein
MKSQRVAALGCSRPRRSLTGEGDLVAAEARITAPVRRWHSRQWHMEMRRFALDREVKLPAKAARRVVMGQLRGRGQVGTSTARALSTGANRRLRATG